MDDPFGLEELYDPETLAAVDGWRPPGREPPELPSRVVRWSRSTLVGMVVTGFALGMQEVLEPQEELIVVEVDADGEPHDLPVRLFLAPDDPSGSLCIVRRDAPPPLL